MLTAKQRIDAIFTDWVREEQTLEQLERRVVRAVEEQDRDTRHACADAVVALPSEDFEGVPVIGKEAARAACMNVRAA